MNGQQLWIGPIDAGVLTAQELHERRLNPFAVHLLVESVSISRLLEAVPEAFRSHSIRATRGTRAFASQ